MADISNEEYLKLFNEFKDTLKLIETGDLEARFREMESFIRNTKMKLRVVQVELSERADRDRESIRLSDEDYKVKSPIEPVKVAKVKSASQSPTEKAIQSMIKAGMSEKRAREMFEDED